jgi:hypothetical protein
MDETLTCAAESRTLNESLAGTVKPTGTFFLIETDVPEYGGWGKGIVKTIGKQGDFAPYVQHLLSVPNSKVLLIRKPRANGMNFYIAITNQTDPKLYHTTLSSYDDLLNVDLASIAPDTTPQIGDNELTEIDELYTVCTNGKHDACCSTYGIPVYNALVQHAGEDSVWQVTHIGGHRLTGTMIAFPQGIYYGHLDAINAEEIATNHRTGYLVNHKYRGRSAYGDSALDVKTHQAVGAVEHHIRESAKKYAIGDLTLQLIEATDDMQWHVEFIDADGISYQAKVKTTMSEPRQSSCNEPLKPMPVHTVTEYSLIPS